MDTKLFISFNSTNQPQRADIRPPRDQRTTLKIPVEPRHTRILEQSMFAWTRWPEGCRLTPHFEQGLNHLLDHVKPADVGSYIHSDAESRLLETALTLFILRRDRLDLPWQERLAQYVAGHVEGTDGFSRLIASAVLGKKPPREVVLAGLHRFMGNCEYAKRRKFALLVMILVEVGLIDFADAAIEIDDFSDKAAHKFSKLYRSAMRLMFARHSRMSDDLGEDVRYLVDNQGENGGWEQQTLITLAALMALGKNHPAFARGLKFIKGMSRKDGGIPFCPNQNVWISSLAGLALQAAGVRTDVQRRLASYLVSRQHANGGWAFTEGVTQTDTDCASNCVQMLLQLDPERYADSIRRGLEHLQNLQRDDGGYPTYEREGEPEVTMTANIILAQSVAAIQHPEHKEAIRRAVQFLAGRKKPDGRFEKSWSLCETYSIFRVHWALFRAQPLVADIDLGPVREGTLKYLLESQHEDGGWGQSADMASDGLSSAYALGALCLLRRYLPVAPERINNALKYLVSQQDMTTGAFNSIPDLAGPRPIPFDVPLLSTIFSLLALRFAG